MLKLFNFRIHYTWLVVFGMVTAIVTTQFSEDYPLRLKIIIGLIVSILFFTAVASRELVLRAVESQKDGPGRKITLYFFGGISSEIRSRFSAGRLPLLYLARFLSNLVTAVFFLGLYATFIAFDILPAAGVAQWLAYIYFLLFLLHFIPAFPLDGGQILRLLIWKSTGDFYRSTRIAGLIGWAAGMFLIFAGVMVFIITRDWTIGLATFTVGWTVGIAAGHIRRQVKTHLTLQSIPAENIMDRHYPVMSSQTDIGQLVKEHILKKGWRYVVVMDNYQFKGLLTLERIKSIPGKRWNDTTIGDVMIPSEQVDIARLTQPAGELLEEMQNRGVDYIPVLKDEYVAGVVSRTALMDLVRTRAGFGF